MNGDRRADAVLRDEAGRLWFMPGNGTGRLIGSGGWNAMSALVRHGDFSGDGREDVIARERATGKLWLYPGTGSGGLGARKLIGSGGWNAMNALVGAGDMTGDGRADLVAREKATGKLWLYPGTSTRTLGARKLIGTGGWNAMDHILGGGDTSGDGRPDLEASDGFSLYQYQGLATGGVRKVDNYNGSWWAQEGATAF
ncbi:VCBS repeat-containing protein [Streptomyces exfoliatus]|uniref:VCBS repeat-containing protein n=1 Tax=Streptomyces exfoliatus TaxID=1905 RepID=A0ABV3D678_STREX